ncbi:hypothetical protein PENTCL1PPCAC_4538, partial [Pristionchus entomophagus]
EREFTARHLLSFLSDQPSRLSILSQECKEDLQIIMNVTVNATAYPGFLKSALLPMLDSIGKMGPGILRGHIYFAGHFSECKAVDYVVKDRDRHFRGDYFRVDIDPFLRPTTSNGSCNVVLPFQGGIEMFWELGFCLPDSCTSAELQKLFRPEGGASNPVCKFTKPGDITPDLDAGFYITLFIMGIIAGICVISGFVDFYFSERLKDSPISKSLGWQLLMSCSLYSNISSIFDVSESTKSGQISPIHCIRFFSMVWVLLSHLFSNYLAVVANPVDIMSIARDLTSEVITNGFFCVDSFFFMSGVLLTFLWFKIYQRQPRETMSIYGWIMFYVHRVLRSTWWVELLYLHNYV